MILAYSPLIILLGPLLAGAFIGLFGDRLGEKAYRIAVVADVLGFVLSLHLLYLAASQNAQDVAFSPSLVLYGLDSSLRIDRLAAVMMAHITGISALIDPRGEVLQSIPWQRAGTIDATLPDPLGPTLFARFGNVIPLALAFLMLIAAIALDRRARYRAI